jgi:hypothetical protein
MLGRLQPTEANIACRQLYSRNGFIQSEDNSVLWSRPLTSLPALPPHVALTEPVEEGVPAPVRQTTGRKMGQDEQILMQNDRISLKQMEEARFPQEQLCVAELSRRQMSNC